MREITDSTLFEGIEWAYRKYLNGKDGKILKQKLPKDNGSQGDINEVDPEMAMMSYRLSMFISKTLPITLY
jgi:glutathione peroxidase-family protein